MKRRTNKALFNALKNQLDREIDIVREQLPKTCEREMEEHFIGPEEERSDVFAMMRNTVRKKENYEKRPTGDFKILKGLVAASATLKETSEILEDY